VKAGKLFPSLCHLKVNGEFTAAVVECDADCDWLELADPEVFSCWRVEACSQDVFCAQLFGIGDPVINSVLPKTRTPIFE
jgi:hypothetical protein